MASKEPVKPSKPIIYALALLVGLLLPFGFISIKGLVSSVVESRAAVEQATSTPIVGQIRHLPKGPRIVVDEKSQSQPAEDFHFLRSNLLLHLQGQPGQVIGVGSGAEKEGKAIVALNLAASLGLTGRKVIVLDFNLRQPHLTDYLGQANDEGLTSYLASATVPFEPLVRHTGLGTNVSWMGGGPAAANPAGLLSSPRVEQLLAALRQEYDHIIVVTAPLGVVADTYALAPYFDTFLYVLRLGHSQQEQLRLIDEVSRLRKLRHPLVVLNDGRV